MAKGRRPTLKTELITATLEDLLNAEPTINRLLTAAYEPARQRDQIDLSKRLMLVLKGINNAREDSGMAAIREKLLREHGKKDGERWYFEDAQKQRQYNEGMREVLSADHTIDAPFIADLEIDGHGDAPGFLQPSPALSAGERAAIDFLLTYPDPGGDE
jgi:hypothetical protein